MCAFKPSLSVTMVLAHIGHVCVFDSFVDAFAREGELGPWPRSVMEEAEGPVEEARTERNSASRDDVGFEEEGEDCEVVGAGAEFGGLGRWSERLSGWKHSSPKEFVWLATFASRSA